MLKYHAQLPGIYTKASPGKRREMLLKLSKKLIGFFDKWFAASCAQTLAASQPMSTLSGREVFSAMYTPRRKMMLPYFAAAAAKLYEVILTC